MWKASTCRSSSFGGFRRTDLVGSSRVGLRAGHSGRNRHCRTCSGGRTVGIVARGCVGWVELRLEPRVIRADVVQLTKSTRTSYQ
eukprot:4928653-Heterocapsa_arctica.AAC.1